MRQRQECELLEWTSQQSSSFIVTLNWKYKWHLQKKWQIWGHSHLPDPAEFSVSYQILSVDDPPIEIEIVTRTHLRKYLSWKMNRGLHAAPCIGHLSFRSHLLPSWLNSYLCALKQISIHLIPQRHFLKFVTTLNRAPPLSVTRSWEIGWTSFVCVLSLDIAFLWAPSEVSGWVSVTV